MVPGGIRNIHEGKVSGQLAGASNHLSDRHGTEDYMNIVHRLSNEVWLTVYSSISKTGVYSQMKKCAKPIAYNYIELLLEPNFNFMSDFLCSGGWLCNEESFFSSAVSTVRLLTSREWWNTKTYVYLKLERQVVKWLCTYTCFYMGHSKTHLIGMCLWIEINQWRKQQIFIHLVWKAKQLARFYELFRFFYAFPLDAP